MLISATASYKLIWTSTFRGKTTVHHLPCYQTFQVESAEDHEPGGFVDTFTNPIRLRRFLLVCPD